MAAFFLGVEFMFWKTWRKPKKPDGPSAFASELRSEGLTYLSHTKLMRLEALFEDLDKERVVGSYAEFGIALGGSGILIAKAAQKRQARFFGFDVFGMIPEPTSEKDDDVSRERYSVIASGQSKGIKGGQYYGYVDDLYSQVCTNFEKHGVAVDGKAISLVKGLFEDTVPHVDLAPLALAHLDCDWYDPVRYCLHHLADVIVEGGAIILDDYHHYDGCKIATDEFLSTHPEFEPDFGENVILRRRK